MKSIKKTMTIISSIALFFMIACDKNEDEQQSLPPITQEGANTFGVIVDGRVLAPRNGTGTFNLADYGMILIEGPESYNFNEIDVHDFASERTASINIHILNLRNIGEYRVDESNCEDGIDSPETTNIYCRIYDYEEKIYKQYCSFENSGTIIITRYDSANQIVSGTFSGKARNINDSTDEIEITEGRFDIKWNTVKNKFFP